MLIVLHVVAVLALVVTAAAGAVNAVLNLRADRLAVDHDQQDRERFERHEVQLERADLVQVQLLAELRQMRAETSRGRC